MALRFRIQKSTVISCFIVSTTLAANGSVASAEILATFEGPVSYSEALTHPEWLSEVDPNTPDLEDELTVEDLLSEEEAGLNSSQQPDFNGFWIRDYSPVQSVGKIIIKVHKSANPKVLEYLEVFKQKSENPSDLEPLTLFAGENKALVSTAGTYGNKTYVTPAGVYGIDRLEVMHHSSKYGNAPMPWSIFFNGGIAIHGATPSEFSHLGHKASHGCVRIHPVNAHLLYLEVQKSGNRVIIMVLNS